MAEKSEVGRVVTPEGIMSYPHLFEPWAGKPNEKKRYWLTLIFEPGAKSAAGTTMKDVVNAAFAAAKAQWPGRDIDGDLKKGLIKFPLKIGQKVAEKMRAKGQSGYVLDLVDRPGVLVMKMKTDYQPVVVDQARKEVLDQKEAYAGRYAYASVAFKAGTTDLSGDYVTAYFDMVLLGREGKRIGGRSAAEVFAGIDGGSAEGPGDDIPF